MSATDREKLKNISYEFKRFKNELNSVADILKSEFSGINSDVPATRLKVIASDFDTIRSITDNLSKKAEDW